MFNNTKNTIAASEMITNLEKSGKIGSKGAVEKIKKAIQLSKNNFTTEQMFGTILIYSAQHS